MLQKKLDRRTILIALGGGVVGDLGGFVAACYQRGIRYIQVPTTLLAQVDSSVGGKTAINHPLGKNMIGAFHQPSLVLSDTSLLETLPEREFISGMAEVIKYGLIKDHSFFEWLEQNIEHIMSRSPEALATVIRKSCENKRDVVAKDEKENGVRAILNLGHTFGHAIENLMDYGSWLHGEAVAVGICMASRLSRDQGLISDESYSRIESILQKANLPTKAPKECSPDRMLEIMRGDKKSNNKEINLVLLKAIGEAFFNFGIIQT
jgi:3-dehydroquinate synthase